MHWQKVRVVLQLRAYASMRTRVASTVVVLQMMGGRFRSVMPSNLIHPLGADIYKRPFAMHTYDSKTSLWCR